MRITNRVVVMDDEASFRRPFSNRLRRRGLDVRIAGSLSHLRRLIEKEDFDAAVLDIRMSTSGVEGLTAIMELRNARPQMYIEVITAHENYREPALRLGADRVFVKPDIGEDPAARIREGVLAKQRALLARTANVALEEVRLPEAGEDAEAVCQWMGVITNAIDEIDRFFVEREASLNLAHEEIARVRQELAEVLVQRKAKPGRVREFLEYEKGLLADLNFLAFRRAQVQLTTTHPGLFVAFSEGELVGVNASREALAEEVRRAGPSRRVLIVRVEEQERRVAFRRPRRVQPGGRNV